MLQEQSYLSYFTPSQMSHEMLEAILVRRQKLVTRLVDRVAQSVLTATKHHTLLLGPRGIGKSYLVAMVYHRVKALAELDGKIAIACFAEEEWSIASLADLLLVILKALEREYSGLHTRIEALYRLPVREIENAASALVREFVGTRTLFILMENLDEIFRGLGHDGQWAFRSFLSERPFATLLATTPSLFAGVAEKDEAFYGFFHNVFLDELTVEEATELLEKVAEHRDDKPLTAYLKTPTAQERVQAVHDLAGGHPRIYLLFAHLLTQETLDELVTPFLKLLDELTPYYQSRMQLLSPQQRKIVEFLCGVRGAVAVKEIAARNLLTPQTASGQLDKLEEMAYVRKTPVGREALYELREPLLRMVIEMKRGRGEPVRLIVDFLRRWYSRRERRERLARASVNHPLTQAYLTAALDLELAVHDAPDRERAEELIEKLHQYGGIGNFAEASETAAEIIERMGNATDSSLWYIYGINLVYVRQYEAAIGAMSKVLVLDPKYASAWFIRAEAQLCLGNWKDFYEDITQAFNRLPDERTLMHESGYLAAVLAHEEFGEKVPLLFRLYAEHGALEMLELGLAYSIPNVLADYTSQETADRWLAAWQTTCGEGTELEIPIRLLAAAVKWKKTRSVRALLALPIEERHILESLLPEDDTPETSRTSKKQKQSQRAANSALMPDPPSE